MASVVPEKTMPHEFLKHRKSNCLKALHCEKTQCFFHSEMKLCAWGVFGKRNVRWWRYDYSGQFKMYVPFSLARKPRCSALAVASVIFFLLAGHKAEASYRQLMQLPILRALAWRSTCTVNSGSNPLISIHITLPSWKNKAMLLWQCKVLFRCAGIVTCHSQVLFSRANGLTAKINEG